MQLGDALCFVCGNVKPWMHLDAHCAPVCKECEDGILKENGLSPWGAVYTGFRTEEYNERLMDWAEKTAGQYLRRCAVSVILCDVCKKKGEVTHLPARDINDIPKTCNKCQRDAGGILPLVVGNPLERWAVNTTRHH